jgi:hypothetical protein
LRFKEPANLRALPDSASGRIQLIELIFSVLTALPVSVPEEKDNRQHYTPVSERNAPCVDLVGADEQKGGRQTQDNGVPKFHDQS